MADGCLQDDDLPLIVRRRIDRECLAFEDAWKSGKSPAIEDFLAAVRGAETNSYDIVLMDLGMPGVDGLEAARRIRHLSGVPSSIPIVALTASVADDARPMSGGRHERFSEQTDRSAGPAARSGPVVPLRRLHSRARAGGFRTRVIGRISG